MEFKWLGCWWAELGLKLNCWGWVGVFWVWLNLEGELELFSPLVRPFGCEWVTGMLK